MDFNNELNSNNFNLLVKLTLPWGSYTGVNIQMC